MCSWLYKVTSWQPDRTLKQPFKGTVKASAWGWHSAVLQDTLYIKKRKRPPPGSVFLIGRLHRSRNQVLEAGVTTLTTLPCVPLTEYMLPIPCIFKIHVIKCFGSRGLGDISLTVQGKLNLWLLFGVLLPED